MPAETSRSQLEKRVLAYGFFPFPRVPILLHNVGIYYGVVIRKNQNSIVELYLVLMVRQASDLRALYTSYRIEPNKNKTMNATTTPTACRTLKYGNKL